MLRILDKNKVPVKGLKKYTDLCIESALELNDRTLSFSAPYRNIRNAIENEGYNIADLGTFDKESFLEITLPSGITSLVTSVSLVSPYQIVEGNASLGVRVSSNKVIIVNGVGGNYSAEYIKKGYQGFSVFFITK